MSLSPEPAIIALQEVTQTCWMVLQASSDVRERYCLTDFSRQLHETGMRYGVVVLVRKDLVSEHTTAWEVDEGEKGMRSEMGRRLVGVDLPTYGVRIAPSMQS